MRKSTKFRVFVIILLISYPTITYSQFINNVVQFTEGNNDQNPRFPVFKGGNFSFTQEYFVFERHYPLNSSDIFIRKVGPDGPWEAEIELTNDGQQNSHPVIAYNSLISGYSAIPKYLLVAWETSKNGSRDIYGKFFIEGTGWSEEFPIDSSLSNSYNPEIICKDSVNFHIVYEKNGDIFFRSYNILTSILSSETNITNDDTAYCKNPFISVFGPYNNEDSLTIVSYERNVSPTYVPIHYKTNSNGSWSLSKPITSTGKNQNNGFPGTVDFDGILAAYEKVDSIRSDVYTTLISLTGNNDSMHVSNQLGLSPARFYSLAGGRPYFLRDNSVSLTVYGFIYDDTFDKEVLLYQDSPVGQNPDMLIQATPEFSFDTLEISLTANHKLSKLLPNGSCNIVWFLFNRSEANQYQSRIYGVQFRNCYYVNITPISSEIPNSFSLKQNYPNPFNPSTKIRFDIPLNSNQVKLNVYNSVGQEVAILIDEQLQPGVYEYDFNASSYPSGVYFYKLEAEEFSQTKKMILLK